jgi:peptidoglycan hydrolase-like protein with peptidoglycan-binding domain
VAEPTLKKGSKKPEVKDLQEALEALGFSPGKIDGVFGAATEKAVKAFQSSVGIDADGIVGPLTWLNIDEADQSEPVLKKGSEGLPVRRLQSRMTAADYDTGGVDGRFGAKTEKAVKQLQEHAALEIDGIVGPATWEVVNTFERESGPR